MVTKKVSGTVPAKSNVKGAVGVIRGEASWAKLPIAYAILITISIGIISVIKEAFPYQKALLIMLVSSLLFILCFFVGRFRSLILKLFEKSQNLVEE